MSNTYIWAKAKYTESGIREIVRIIYNPRDKPALQIMKEWVDPEYWKQCNAHNIKIKGGRA